MELKEELSQIRGVAKKKFLLLRMVDIETEVALKLCGVHKGTYNTWCNDRAFVEVHRRRKELTKDYRQDALHMLRKENQIAAILLEDRIVQRMREEVETGDYKLIRTGLAREVYSKLINDLDYTPQNLSLTWEQRVAQLFTQPEEVEVIEGQVREIEAGEAYANS